MTLDDERPIEALEVPEDAEEADAEAEDVEEPSPIELLMLDGIDAEHLMLEGIDTSKGPLYSVSAMAEFFFVRSSYWVRWLESCHFTYHDKEGKHDCNVAPAQHTPKMREEHQHTWKFMLDGELLLPLRTDSNARKYDLALVERIAHALASNGTIKFDQLRQCLRLVKIQAEMHGYLPDERTPIDVPAQP